MSRKLVLSNVAVVVLFVMGLSYVSIYLIDYNPLRRPYEVTVDLTRTGGVYFNSDVTYLGNPVGDVVRIAPTETGVAITVSIDSDVEIPRDTRVVVASLSPVGEQYLDFQPRVESGPFLTDGDRIPVADTEVPVEFSTMMRNVAVLAEQIKPEPLRTVLDELSMGFGDPEADLNRLVVDADRVLAALEKVTPDTVRLLRDGNVVLQAASDLRPELQRFSASAAQLTRDIRSGEPVWRRTVAKVPGDLDRVMAVVDKLTEPFAAFADSVAPVLDVLSSRVPAIQELLRVTKAAADTFGKSMRGGYIVSTVYLELNGQLCTYRDGKIQHPWIAQRPKIRYDEKCGPHGPRSQQRGSENAPRP